MLNVLKRRLREVFPIRDAFASCALVGLISSVIAVGIIVSPMPQRKENRFSSVSQGPPRIPMTDFPKGGKSSLFGFASTSVVDGNSTETGRPQSLSQLKPLLEV